MYFQGVQRFFVFYLYAAQLRSSQKNGIRWWEWWWPWSGGKRGKIQILDSAFPQ
ncbi:hypothetical protein BACCAP_01640 [Pseudoflavonifractor capillosus ATCC 29799]|uniref:Uncharacterized protein n=1 Tax=Pseudoflavonifractor capillosus ATCC 29799 TaxID=411467 RepID=A6NTW1_9FIRM|nr:hypothetical protein BACCAP_01640 [Pseudoflavonifractor capillosus ATCC 29799]